MELQKRNRRSWSTPLNDSLMMAALNEQCVIKVQYTRCGFPYFCFTVQRGSMGIQLMWDFRTNKWLGLILQIELLELTYIFWPEKVSVHLYLPIWCTPRSQINKWRVFLDFFMFTWPFSLLIWCEALLCIWEIIINKQMMIGSLIWFAKHNFD